MVAKTDHAHSHSHIIPLKVYLGVWGALLALTVVTVAAAQVDLGALNVPLALGIASVKAALVALFFMHLYYDERFNLVALGAGIVFVIIFIALTVWDPMTRGEVNRDEKQEINPAIVRPEAGPKAVDAAQQAPQQSAPIPSPPQQGGAPQEGTPQQGENIKPAPVQH